MPYKDPEKAKEYNRKKKLEYYHRNPDKFNKKRKLYKKTRVTKEKQQEYSARYYSKNIEKCRKRKRDYDEKHRDEVNKRARDAIRDLNRGIISYPEYCGRVQQVIDEINDKC